MTDLALALDGIVVVEGAAGVGKTSSATELAIDSGLRCAYFQLPTRAGRFDLRASLYQAVTGETAARGRVPQHRMTSTILDALSGGDVLVLADDIHLGGTDGIQELRWFWDQVVMERGEDARGFPMWLIGVDVVRAIAKSAELTSRVLAWTTVKPLTLAQLLPVVARLDGRLAVTDDDLIGRLNDQAGGNLRNWDALVRELRGTWPDANGPVTEKEAESLLGNKPDFSARARRSR